MAGSLVPGSAIVTPGDINTGFSPEADALLRRVRERRAQERTDTATTNTLVAAPENPDTLGAARTAGREIGVPVELADGAPEEVEREARRRRIQELLANAPTTAAWLNNPSNARISHDSVDQLSFLERTARAFRSSVYEQEAGRVTTLNFFNDRAAAERATADLDALIKANQDPTKSRGFWESFTDPGEYGKAIGNLAGSIFSTSTSANVLAGAGLGIAAVATAPVSAPLGLGVIAGGATVGFFADAIQTSVGSLLRDMREKGVAEGPAKVLSAVGGVLIGAVEGIADKFGRDTISGPIKRAFIENVTEQATRLSAGAAARQAATTYTGNIALQASTEVVQEAIAVAAEEIGKVLTSPDLTRATPEEIVNRLNGVLATTIQGVAVLGAPGGIARYRADRADQKQAEANRDALGKVNQELSNGNLAQRDREAAVEHAATILPEVGIPADRFVEVLQQKQLTTLIDELGIGDRVEKAIEQGTDIRFTPEEHARLHLSEAGRDLLDHIRVDPNGMTFAESKEIGEAGIDQEVDAAAQPTAEEPPLTNTQRADLLKMGFTEQDLQGATAADYEALQGEAKLTKAQKNFLLALGFSKEQADAMNRAEFAQVQKLAPAGTLADPDNPSLAEAETLIGFQQLIRDAKSVGMSQQGYVSYLQAIAEAKQEAANRLERLRLQEERAKLDAEYQRAAEIEKQIAREEVDSRPVFAFLTSISPTEMFNRDDLILALREERGQLGRIALSLPEDAEALLKSLPKAPNGSLIFTTKADKQGGLPASYLANKYGFNSVTEMVTALQQAPNRTVEILQRTDERMAENHPELVAARTDLDKAIEATHNNKAGGVLLQEVNALRREQGQGTLRYAVVKQAAAQKFAQMRLGEISPSRFFNAERRKAREAGQAIRKNDRRLAATRAFERLLNFEWARNAYRWQNEVRKDTKFIRAQFTADRSRSKGDLSEAADYFDAAKLVLIQNGLYEGDFDVSRISDEAQSLVNPNLMTQRSQATMTVGEWRTVIDEARRLVKAGQDASKVAVGKAEADLETTVNDLVSTAEVLKDAVGESAEQRALGENLGWFTRAAKGAKATADAFSAQVEFMLRRLDNGVVAGKWYKVLFEPLVDAQFRSLRMKENLEAHFAALAEIVAKHDTKGATTVQGGLLIEGLPRQLTLQQRVMIALNMGNASNLDKTVRGFKATEAQLVAEVSALPPEARKWVQDTWDIFERFRPEVEAVYRSKMGKSPEMIRAVPLKFKDGETIRGGYFPMMYDPVQIANRSPLLAPDKPSATGQMNGDFFQDVVASGMTKERTEFAAEITTDIGRVSLAIDAVVHYVTHYDAVNSVKRVLRQSPIQNVVQKKLGVAQYQVLENWVADVAADGDHQKLDELSQRFSPWAEKIRQNIVIAALTYSATALMAQGLGFATSVNQLGRNPDGSFKGGGTRFLRGVMTVVSSPRESVKLMNEKSPLMRDRIRTADQAIGEQIDRLRNKRGPLRDAAAFGLTLLPRFQFYAADAPTWMAAYDKAIGEGRADADAVQYADSVVRTSQGGGGNLALSGMQRSRNPMLRVTTMFATYPAILYNNLSEVAGDVRQDPKKAVRGAVTRLFWMLVVSAVLDSLRQGQEPKEDEDPLYFYLKRILANAVSAVPVIGDPLSSAILGFRNPDSAIATMTNASTGAFNTITDFAFGDLETEKAVPRLAKDLGILFGLPGSAQAGRTLEALFSDETEGPFDYIVGPPKK